MFILRKLFFSNSNWFVFPFRRENIIDAFTKLTAKSLDGATDGFIQSLYAFLMLYHIQRSIRNGPNTMYI